MKKILGILIFALGIFSVAAAAICALRAYSGAQYSMHHNLPFPLFSFSFFLVILISGFAGLASIFLDHFFILQPTQNQPVVYHREPLVKCGVALAYLGIAVILFNGFASSLRDRIGIAVAINQEQKLKKHAEMLAIGAKAGPPITIKLDAYTNAALTDSVFGGKHTVDNNLASLPTGLQQLAGVPFEITGVVQLMGRCLDRFKKTYPTQAAGIKIGKTFLRMHLLHATGFDARYGAPIASIVLHYADGSMSELPIRYGIDVGNWWGDPGYKTQSLESQLAWSGTNPRIARASPRESLLLFRSTFLNPYPDKEVATLDYVSHLTEAAPFLIGLTID